MPGSRRQILLAFLSAWGAAYLWPKAGAAQNPVPGPPKTPGQEKNPETPDLPANSTKNLLEQNQKEIKKDIEKLYDLVMQLKQEIEKTDSSAVLSLTLVKKAEEAEKLARLIKERARG